MSTLARTLSGDLALPVIGQSGSALVTDPNLCAALKIADGLSMLLGEWTFDQNQGFPWKQQVWGQKPPNVVAIQQLIRKAILQLGAPTVIAVTDVAVFAASVRQLTYTFAASTNDGAVITGGEGKPFVVIDASGNAVTARAA